MALKTYHELETAIANLRINNQDISGSSTTTLFQDIDYMFRFARINTPDRIGTIDLFKPLEDKDVQLSIQIVDANTETSLNMRFFTFTEALMTKKLTSLVKSYEMLMVEWPLYQYLETAASDFLSEEGSQKEPKDIVKELFKNTGYELIFDDTSKVDKIDYIPPMGWNRIDSIEHLKRYSATSDGQFGKSVFKLFPSGKNKLNYRSLAKMLEGDSLGTFKFFPVNTDEGVKFDQNSVLTYWIDMGDKTSLKGGQGKTNVGFDYKTGEFIETSINRSDIVNDLGGTDINDIDDNTMSELMMNYGNDSNDINAVNSLQSQLIDPLKLWTISYHNTDLKLGDSYNIDIYKMQDRKMVQDTDLSKKWTLKRIETYVKDTLCYDKLLWIKSGI